MGIITGALGKGVIGHYTKTNDNVLSKDVGNMFRIVGIKEVCIVEAILDMTVLYMTVQKRCVENYMAVGWVLKRKCLFNV